MGRIYTQTDVRVNREFDYFDERVSRLEQNPIPVGGMLLWSGGPIPRGFLSCDGSSYAVGRYPKLFEVLERRGPTPTPDSEDNFAVPDVTVGNFRFIIKAETT